MTRAVSSRKPSRVTAGHTIIVESPPLHRVHRPGQGTAHVVGSFLPRRPRSQSSDRALRLTVCDQPHLRADAVDTPVGAEAAWNRAVRGIPRADSTAPRRTHWPLPAARTGPPRRGSRTTGQTRVTPRPTTTR